MQSMEARRRKAEEGPTSRGQPIGSAAAAMQMSDADDMQIRAAAFRNSSLDYARRPRR